MARGQSSKRRKQSAHDKAASKKPKDGNPKSMVIRIGAGEVGASVSQLVTDVRQVMQPDTAVRLKVGHSFATYECSLSTVRRNGETTNFAITPLWLDPSE